MILVDDEERLRLEAILNSNNIRTIQAATRSSLLAIAEIYLRQSGLNGAKCHRPSVAFHAGPVAVENKRVENGNEGRVSIRPTIFCDACEILQAWLSLGRKAVEGGIILKAERLGEIWCNPLGQWGQLAWMWQVHGAEATRSGPRVFSRVIVLVGDFAISAIRRSGAERRAGRYVRKINIDNFNAVNFWPNKPFVAVTNGHVGERTGIVHLDGVSAWDGSGELGEETVLRPSTISYAIANDGTWVVMAEGEKLDEAIDRYGNRDDSVDLAEPVEPILEEDLEVLALLPLGDFDRGR